MNPDELAEELASIGSDDWTVTVRHLHEIDDKKLELALGIISMDERGDREAAVLRALNTSKIPRQFLWRARGGRRRHPRELAMRLISGDSKPGFKV